MAPQAAGRWTLLGLRFMLRFASLCPQSQHSNGYMMRLKAQGDTTETDNLVRILENPTALNHKNLQ